MSKKSNESTTKITTRKKVEKSTKEATDNSKEIKKVVKDEKVATKEINKKEKKIIVKDNTKEELKTAKNPYDPSNRDYTFLWDASYYKGNYYCYFGLWPILTIMAPFKIITTKYLTTPIVCLFYAIISIISTLLLYNSIIKKYFKNITFQTYILSFIFIIFGSKILWCMNRPSFYELVSLASYAHIILGLYLVIFSNNKIFGRKIT